MCGLHADCTASVFPEVDKVVAELPTDEGREALRAATARFETVLPDAVTREMLLAGV